MAELWGFLHHNNFLKVDLMPNSMGHNPLADFIDEFKELIVVGFMVFVFILILGILATIPGAPPEAKVVAEQGQEAINYMWIIYLGIPSTALIGFIIWIVIKIKKAGEEQWQGI